MEINYIDIGKRIQEQRVKLGITQEKLAEIIDLTVGHLSGIENGKTKFSFQTLINIANALDVTTDMLLCGSLKQGAGIIREEFAELLADCTTEECVVMVETLKTLKNTLRQQITGGDII
jgi:transcriptional regulator with XRE-family HTH domain